MGRPRLLVVITLAEAGGAQTFCARLIAGLRDRYAIEVAAHGPLGPLVDTCRALDIPFHHLAHMRRRPHPVGDLRAVAELRALVRRIRPDAVQLNSAKAATLARVGLAGTGIPAIYTVHGWSFAGRSGAEARAWTAIEWTTAPLARAIVCVSRYDRDLAVSHGVAGRAPTLVIHNGVVLPTAAPVRGAWPASPTLLCIARLSPQKDVATLLEALALPGCERWRLQVAGEGPDLAKLEAQIDRLGLRDRVQMLGQRDDVPALLVAADALVLPSNWEGLPFSILEAMAAGLPVVASIVGGVPELVRDGVTGALVPPRDVPALARALAQLDADGARARAQGRAGFELAHARFSLGRMVDRYDAVIGGLVRQGRGNALSSSGSGV